MPADKLYVDFAGKPLYYINPSTGELIACQVFVACLPFSDYSFAIAVPSQRIADFLYALECCLLHIGGTPRILVPDNLKSAIIKADRYEPEVNRSLEDFANHYDVAVVPTRPRMPRDKALVENQVKLIYNRVYARLRNRQFFSLDALNEAIKGKIKTHNQTRMQQKPWCREERFLAAESIYSVLCLKPLLKSSIIASRKWLTIITSTLAGISIITAYLLAMLESCKSDLHPFYGLYLCPGHPDCSSH